MIIYNDGLPRPNDAGPIVHRPMELPIMAGYSLESNQDLCDASSTEMQCLDRCTTR